MFPVYIVGHAVRPSGYLFSYLLIMAVTFLARTFITDLSSLRRHLNHMALFT